MKKLFLMMACLVVTFLTGCAFLKPAARTVNDVARFACESTLGAEADRQGVSVEELCRAREVLDPFIRQILAAQAAARAGLKPPPPVPL